MMHAAKLLIIFCFLSGEQVYQLSPHHKTKNAAKGGIIFLATPRGLNLNHIMDDLQIINDLIGIL